jgi:hypothetical protein
MVTHITDDEVQLFILDRQQCEARIVEHIHACEECKIKAAVYRSLITGIKQQPEPAFEFDLSALVLDQLPSPKQKISDRTLLLILIFVGVSLFGATAYYFQASFAFLFAGLSSIFVYLIMITVVTVLVGLLIDMFKKYNKEMKLLDSF